MEIEIGISEMLREENENSGNTIYEKSMWELESKFGSTHSTDPLGSLLIRVDYQYWPADGEDAQAKWREKMAGKRRAEKRRWEWNGFWNIK